MLFRTAEERGELTMKNLNNRAKATIVMITSFGLVLSLMSCTSCDVKTGSPPVSIPETSAAGSVVSEVSVVSEASAVSEVTESSEESVAISDSVATSATTSESESTSASTARQVTPTPKPTRTPVSAGTNNAATPTPVPTATPAPVPTATPTPKPTATPTPTPTKVSQYQTLRINWDDQLLAEAAAKGIDINAKDRWSTALLYMPVMQKDIIMLALV